MASGAPLFMTAMAATLAAVVVAALSGCGAVAIHPEPKLPKPLLQPLPARVGLIVAPDMRKYLHKETRWGVDWQVALGPGHERLMHDMFADEFEHVEEFKDLDAARAASNLQALFEPRIDQYSFVTSRETGGRYYAVTIRYRINLYTPQGERSDSFTLTGYGNSLASGMRSSTPLARATNAAMRDAAAKFLVQFPELAAGQKLAHHEAVPAETVVAKADSPVIEAVPIEDDPNEVAVKAQPTPAVPDSDVSAPAPAAAAHPASPPGDVGTQPADQPPAGPAPPKT